MGFAFFFFVAWMAISVFGFMKKRLTLVENTVLLLLIIVISIHWSWIIFEELKLVEISKEPINYTTFLIHRSITIPLMVVIAINFVKRSASMSKALLTAGLSVLLLVVLVLIGRFVGITHTVHWNLIYDVVYFALLHVIAYFFLKYFHHLGQSEAERV
ncbi:hypothetical protein [Paenibacillus mucilaginosus]|uniref:Uncharacterized protein n=1 Tax=Paenibacillus mucilaginosus (strain KNP414) TaxID=1036673 RepID=F8FCW8_PAEMK|nr:hypothetical protein [Paenibacillus mucilaginosus]AEI39690.1 hypothetical protein KNP414_01122 [Paenibacillus mucilaginosus KNP414]MCG7218141.1 hypothetical protein [Paenibacillus mucilaginosus]WDM28990.1 hypothetical protein KCX80_07400 [Paenibacillus mucilaginosus]